MIKKIYLFALLGFAGKMATAQIPSGYYDAATGLNCASLKTTLATIVTNGHASLVYGQLDDIQMPVVDTIRTDDGSSFMTWDVYSNNNSGPEPFTFSMAQSAAGGFCGGTTPAVEGVCWNKEHLFPRAWFRNSDGTYPSPTQADLFIVRPADSKINSRRAGYPYATIGSPTYQFPIAGQFATYPMPPNPTLDKMGPSNATNVTIPIAFEPSDAIKGDIARSYFYIATRYESVLSTWVTTNSGNGVEKVIDAANTFYPSFNLPYLAMLYQWHLNDPVDTRESHRNDLVYSQQNNRDPYIDHPEYAALVWQCTGVIPVTITDFVASKDNESVFLKWYATYESNFSRFDIERSTDGINFNKIGEVTGRNLANYNYADNDLPRRPVLYYRLKMIDDNGRFTYSKIIAIRLGNYFSNALVYPNPSAGKLHIKLLESLQDNSRLSITDISGRTLKNETLKKGTVTIELNVDDLPDGRYFMRIYNSSQVINESFVIVK